MFDHQILASVPQAIALAPRPYYNTHQPSPLSITSFRGPSFMPSITIAGHTFILSPRYGNDAYIPTRAEFDALESLRAENIRNNTSRWVGAAIAEHGELLPTEIQDGLQDKITKYADTYNFMPRVRERQATAFEVELRECAEDHIRRMFPGIEVEDPERFEELTQNALLASPVQEAARQRAHARRDAAAQALDELLDPTLSGV